MSPQDLNVEGQGLWQLLDALAIYATRIGYRTDSTPGEREFAGALFRINDTWQEARKGLVTA